MRRHYRFVIDSLCNWVSGKILQHIYNTDLIHGTHIHANSIPLTYC